MSLATIKKTVFNPLLQIKEEVETYLKSLPNNNGAAHVFEKTLLVIEEGGNIAEIDISDKEESFFFNATDLNTLSEIITQRVERFSAQLEKFKEYTIISLVTPYLEVPFVSDERTIVVLSVRDPTFYDFCLGNDNGDMVLFCNTTHNNLPGIQHSGDQTQGNDLLHSITFTDPLTENPFALFVSGYSRNALHKYKPQNPAVTICDHHAKIMYVVPVPLDEATIGQATLCVPVVGRRRGDKLCFSILPAAVTSDQVAGGSNLGGDTLTRAIAREPPPPPPPGAADTTTGTTDKPGKKKARTEAEEGTGVEDGVETLTVEVDTAKPLFVTEEGCKFPEFAKSQKGNHVSFFQGITVHAEAPDDIEMNEDSRTVVLPCVLGNELEGSMILALGQPFKGAKVSKEQYTRLFDKASTVVFTVSDRMTDQARVLNPDLRCNALFIVQKTGPIAEQANASVEDMLNEIKINAITSLAGPQSLVVVQLGDRYYFYRGIRWPGIIEEIPKFGEDITEAVEALFEIPAEKKPWSNIVTISGDPQVYFRGNVSTPDDLYTNFTSLKLEELELFKPDILDTLAQVQVVISPKELPGFTSKLQTALKEIMDASFADEKKAYIDTLLASRGQNRDPKLMEAYKRKEKQAKVAIQWFIDALGALVSTRISSTRKYDLKQMIRKQKILDNVAAAKDMTYEGLGELLEEHCAEVGMVISNIESDLFKQLLRKVSKGEILPHLQSLPRSVDEPRVCQLDDRVLYLNSLDSSIILPMSQTNHDGPLAMETGKLALAFPWGISSGRRGSAFAFACFDQFINIKHPYSQFWVELCNLHHVSMFRIIQRGTVAHATQSREFNIPPPSKDLGFLLVYSLTDTMASLALTRSGVPKEAKFGEEVDTTTKMMRGLFGYLMTSLAAGVQPMSMAWQMLSKTTSLEIPPKEEFWLYSRIIKLFPYTAWPQAQFRKNVRLLVARLIRKQITDPVTKPLRDSMAQIQQNKIQEYIKHRNIQLKWCEVTVDILGKLITGDYKGKEEEVRAICERLISVVPAEEVENKKGKRGLWRCMRAFEQLRQSGDVSKIDETTKKDAAMTFAKRSAALKDLKTKFVEAAENEPTKALPILEEIEEKRREIAARFKAQQVKLQNHKNIYAAVEKIKADGDNVDKKALKKILKSDAEMYREPWLVGKPAEPEESKMHLVHFILTGDMTAPTEEKSSKEVVVPVIKTLDQRLAALPGGDKAGKLVLVVEKMKDLDEFFNISQLPRADFMDFFNLSKSNEENDVETLKRAIIIYLEGWGDVVAAEERVCEFLKGKKGKDEEKEIKASEPGGGVVPAPKEEEGEKKEEKKEEVAEEDDAMGGLF